MSSNSGPVHSTRRAGVALLLGIVLTLALNACGGGSTLIPTQSPTASSTAKATATPTPKPATAFAYAFARDGQAIVVTGAGNSRARLVGAEQLVSNGVIQPLDAVAAPAS